MAINRKFISGWERALPSLQNKTVRQILGTNALQKQKCNHYTFSKSADCTTLFKSIAVPYCSIGTGPDYAFQKCRNYTFEKRSAATFLKSAVSTLLCLQCVFEVFVVTHYAHENELCMRHAMSNRLSFRLLMDTDFRHEYTWATSSSLDRKPRKLDVRR